MQLHAIGQVGHTPAILVCSMISHPTNSVNSCQGPGVPQESVRGSKETHQLGTSTGVEGGTTEQPWGARSLGGCGNSTANIWGGAAWAGRQGQGWKDDPRRHIIMEAADLPA